MTAAAGSAMVALSLLSALLAAPGASAGTDTSPARSTRLPMSGPVQVMLELEDAPSSVAYAAALGAGRRAAGTASRAQRGQVLAGQRAVRAALGRDATRARTLFATSAVYSGIAVSTDAGRLAALSALPGVKAVHLLTPRRMANSSTVPLVGAPTSWASSGTGTGIRIGIIDSGIDYTHADFGGPGTTQAYAAARASSTAPPTYPVAGNVVGGVDLAGDAYDPGATLADGSPDPAGTTPRRDPNPLDCDGHGTHVAGTAAGLGVAADGSTYRGPWTDGLAASTFRVGPGVAPGASLYAIRVFGCAGSTDLTTQALDWAADPNRDGDVGDRLDVVNLSLGGDFASPQDPDAVAADNLAALGTVVVAAAGNAGDLQDAVGSPGSATRAIAVAASDDAVSVVDGLEVPAGIEASPSLDGSVDGVLAAEQSSGDPEAGIAAYDWAGRGGVRDTPIVAIATWAAPTATPVAAGENADGCDPYTSAQAAAVAGKVVLARWTELTERRCGSAQRGARAVAAGAVGVVLGADADSFAAGVAGDPRLPMMLLVQQGTDALKGAIDASGNDGSVRVSMTDAHQDAVRVDLSGTSGDPTDRVGDFSSRGFGTARAVKPDVTAPGVTVFSAAAGTGAAGRSESGTSMAAPHVAGVAALVRAAHPAWSVEQVKAAIMGTATTRVRAQRPGGPEQGPARAGAGRVRADLAVSTDTLAYGASTPGAVGLSFGDVAAAADTTLTRSLRVVNTGPGPRRYVVRYRPAVSTPGVTFSVWPAQVSVPSASAVRVEVRVRLQVSAMRRTLDPSMSPGDGLRSYYADAGGSVMVTGGSTPLTVPVYIAPRPASTMSAAPTAAVGATGRGTLALVGGDLLQGSGPDLAADPTVYASTVTAAMLQGTSPRRPTCSPTVLRRCIPFADDLAGDLRYVGVASDAPYVRDPFSRADGADSGLAYFAVSTWGPWRTPASYVELSLLLNTDPRTAAPELVLINSRLEPDSDVMVATLIDLRTGEVVDQQPLNGVAGSLDTGLFHSDAMVLPVSLPALLPYLPKRTARAPASTRVGYWVQAFTVESGLTDGIASQARQLSVDVRSPALRAAGDAGGPAVNDDARGADFALSVTRVASGLAADAPLGLLLIHHQNLNGARAQVVRVGGATSTRLRSPASSYRYGLRPVLGATVRPGFGTTAPTGTVTFRDGGKVIGRAALVRGTATVRPSAMLRGVHPITATYDGDRLWLPSAGPKVTLRVTR